MAARFFSWLSGNKGEAPVSGLPRVQRATLRVGPKSVELSENGSPLRLGRAPSNDVVLDHESISAQHAKVKFDKKAIWIQDNRSKQGCFVNDRRIASDIWIALRSRDRVLLGQQEIVFDMVLEVDPTRIAVPVPSPEPSLAPSRTAVSAVEPESGRDPILKFAAAGVLGLLVLSLAIWALLGVSVDDKLVIGRWVEEKTPHTWEFTEQHLYSMVGNGEQVESGVWKIEGDEIVLEVFGGPRRGQTERWKPDVDSEDKFTLSRGNAFIRTFIRVKDDQKLFDERLLGLWQSEGPFPEVVGFSSRGVLIGWSWRLSDKSGSGEPFTIGTWGKVSKGISDVFHMEGFTGNMPVTAGRSHSYHFDGGKLVWRKPRSRKDGVFRKVQLTDLEPSSTRKANPESSEDSADSSEPADENEE